MLAKAILLWVVGLATFVPYGTYYLFFEASRDQYALLVTSILFWTAAWIYQRLIRRAFQRVS
jgi:hypothetical protein